MVSCDIKKIDETFYAFEISPFEDDNVKFNFKFKRSELYEVYTKLRGIFEN